MSSHTLTIEKLYNGEYWVNVYQLQATDLDNAGSPAAAILNAERAITDNRITFTKFSIRTNTPLDYVYVTVPVNLQGAKDWGGSDLLPLFNVVRVDLAAAVGRPSRKYLRGVLGEASTLAMNITDAVLATIQSDYCNIIAAVTQLVDNQGDDIIAATPVKAVGMRQLRRGSKKKLIP